MELIVRKFQPFTATPGRLGLLKITRQLTQYFALVRTPQSLRVAKHTPETLLTRRSKIKKIVRSGGFGGGRQPPDRKHGSGLARRRPPLEGLRPPEPPRTKLFLFVASIVFGFGTCCFGDVGLTDSASGPDLEVSCQHGVLYTPKTQIITSTCKPPPLPVGNTPTFLMEASPQRHDFLHGVSHYFARPRAENAAPPREIAPPTPGAECVVPFRAARAAFSSCLCAARPWRK